MAATIREDAPYKEFAERLTKLRTEAGLTRAQLGEKIGVAGRSIINYENGERIPYGDTCAKMAEVFGITTDELLGVENPEVEMERYRIKERRLCSKHCPGLIIGRRCFLCCLYHRELYSESSGKYRPTWFLYDGVLFVRYY